MRPKNKTGYLQRAWLRVPAGADDFPVDRAPAVWQLDDQIYVVVGGRRYLDSLPDHEVINCRILDASTLEEAREMIRPGVSGRPLLGSLQKLVDRIRRLPEMTTEERAFLAALEYVTTGTTESWPERIGDLR